MRIESEIISANVACFELLLSLLVQFSSENSLVFHHDMTQIKLDILPQGGTRAKREFALDPLITEQIRGVDTHPVSRRLEDVVAIMMLLYWYRVDYIFTASCG